MRLLALLLCVLALPVQAPAQAVAPRPVNAPALRQPQQCTVLVVEDNAINQLVTRGMLLKLGYQVRTADNGAEALEVLRNEPIDAVLLDYHMPVLDGIATAAEIRLLPGPAGQVPIIMVTADVVNDTKEKALSAGVTQFAPKPMQEADLRRALRRCGLLEGSADTQPAPLELPKRTQRSMQQLVDAQVHGELLEMMPREMFEQLLDMLLAKKRSGDRRTWLETKGNLASVQP